MKEERKNFVSETEPEQTRAGINNLFRGLNPLTLIIIVYNHKYNYNYKVYNYICNYKYAYYYYYYYYYYYFYLVELIGWVWWVFGCWFGFEG